MARRIDTQKAHFNASPIKLRIARLGGEGSQRFCLDSEGDLSRIAWD